MNNITINNNVYKIKKMNAIQILSFRTQIDFDNYDKVKNLYELVLENIEVQCNDKWLTVKQGNNFYPAGIENDVETIEKLLNYFLEYIKEVFQKSGKSKEE